MTKRISQAVHKSPARIRREYAGRPLNENKVARDPIRQFRAWFSAAVRAKLPEPNAMSVATVGGGARPATRMLLLKGISNGQLVFFTNYGSRKGRELTRNSRCAILFFWPELERQVRIEGIVQRVDEKVSDRYFASRPRGAQLSAWASRQSSVVKNRAVLEHALAQLTKRFEGRAVPRPKNWGGFAVTPSRFEFWQGRADRLHDRLVYRPTKRGSWKIERLAP